MCFIGQQWATKMILAWNIQRKLWSTYRMYQSPGIPSWNLEFGNKGRFFPSMSLEDAIWQMTDTSKQKICMNRYVHMLKKKSSMFLTGLAKIGAFRGRSWRESSALVTPLRNLLKQSTLCLKTILLKRRREKQTPNIRAQLSHIDIGPCNG